MLVFLTIPLVEFAGDVVPIDPRNLRFLRLIRVLRLLRAAKVFRFVKNVEELAESIGRASPSLVHMILLLLVFYFCFGVMGVAFFGLMCPIGLENHPMAQLTMKCPASRPIRCSHAPRRRGKCNSRSSRAQRRRFP